MSSRTFVYGRTLSSLIFYGVAKVELTVQLSLNTFILMSVLRSTLHYTPFKYRYQIKGGFTQVANKGYGNIRYRILVGERLGN